MNWTRTSHMLGQALGILERTQLMVDVNSEALESGPEKSAADQLSWKLERILSQLMDLTLKCTPVTRVISDTVIQDIPPTIVSSYKQNGVLV